MADQPIRWGILGTGRIAGEFAAALPFVKGSKLVAVGSRTQAAADAFGDKFNIRDFHDAVLASGSVPLDVLEKNVQDYIEAAQAR